MLEMAINNVEVGSEKHRVDIVSFCAINYCFTMEVPKFLKIATYFWKHRLTSWILITGKFNMSKWPPEWELFNEVIALPIDICFLNKNIKNADFLKTFPDLYQAERWRYCYGKS